MKSYTDIEQSKKLAEILPLESADMCCFQNPNGSINYYGFPFLQGNKDSNPIPCWSLAALLDVLPYPYIKQNYKGKWTCRVEHRNTTYLWEDSNPIDACVAMVEKLHEMKIL